MTEEKNKKYDLEERKLKNQNIFFVDTGDKEILEKQKAKLVQEATELMLIF